MSIEAPYPELVELLTMMGEAGSRLSEINASEGAAGNISLGVGWPIEPRRQFPVAETIPLPQTVPHLAGWAFLITGSGRRLREIIHDPAANVGVLVVGEGGVTGTLRTSPRRAFARLTSEFNSHLAVHADQIQRSHTNFHAVVHAQPQHLTFLSHIARYRDEATLNRRLLRWQPELIIQLPMGVRSIPFLLPGSAELMAANVEALTERPLAVWSKHGVMARSAVSVKRAADLIEYAETAARYEYMNLLSGEPADCLSEDEMRRIAHAFGAPRTFLDHG